MPDFGIIPRSLTRRLVLSLAGFRCRDGLWVSPVSPPTLAGLRAVELLTEEQIDRLSERRWRALVQAWLTSAVSAN
jgi:hypothetical protein